MIDAKPSRTALTVAFARAEHRERDDRPWVFDDPFAAPFIGDRWDRMADQGAALFTPGMRAGARAFVCARARYAEDRLEAGDFAQYVILGAGLDTFAWRRPDLLHRFRIFEIDHPASQAFKLKRAAEIGLRPRESVTYIAVDFEKESLREALTRGRFEWTRPAFVSWLGVTMYLSTAATEETLRTLSLAAAGSEAAISWCPDPRLLDEQDRRTRDIFLRMAAGVGEPADSTYTDASFQSMIERCGLSLAEHPTTDDIAARYFAGRADGLKPYGMERVSIVRVGA